MFETKISTAIHPLLYLVEEGRAAWPWISLNLKIPLFFIEHLVSEGDDIFLGEVLLFVDVKQLVNLCSSPQFRLKEAHLVSPDYVNQQKSWRMDPLREIWTGDYVEQGRTQTVTEYVLGTGMRYFNSPTQPLESNLLNRQLLLRLNPIENSSNPTSSDEEAEIQPQSPSSKAKSKRKKA
jgi:hypothetical protein